MKACCFYSPKKSLIFRKNGGFSYLLETACQPILKLAKLPTLIHAQETIF